MSEETQQNENPSSDQDQNADGVGGVEDEGRRALTEERCIDIISTSVGKLMRITSNTAFRTNVLEQLGVDNTDDAVDKLKGIFTDVCKNTPPDDGRGGEGQDSDDENVGEVEEEEPEMNCDFSNMASMGPSYSQFFSEMMMGEASQEDEEECTIVFETEEIRFARDVKMEEDDEDECTVVFETEGVKLARQGMGNVKIEKENNPTFTPSSSINHNRRTRRRTVLQESLRSCASPFMSGSDSSLHSQGWITPNATFTPPMPPPQRQTPDFALSQFYQDGMGVASASHSQTFVSSHSQQPSMPIRNEDANIFINPSFSSASQPIPGPKDKPGRRMTRDELIEVYTRKLANENNGGGHPPS